MEPHQIYTLGTGRDSLADGASYRILRLWRPTDAQAEEQSFVAELEVMRAAHMGLPDETAFEA